MPKFPRFRINGVEIRADISSKILLRLFEKTPLRVLESAILPRTCLAFAKELQDIKGLFSQCNKYENFVNPLGIFIFPLLTIFNKNKIIFNKNSKNVRKPYNFEYFSKHKNVQLSQVFRQKIGKKSEAYIFLKTPKIGLWQMDIIYFCGKSQNLKRITLVVVVGDRILSMANAKELAKLDDVDQVRAQTTQILGTLPQQLVQTLETCSTQLCSTLEALERRCEENGGNNSDQVENCWNFGRKNVFPPFWSGLLFFICSSCSLICLQRFWFDRRIKKSEFWNIHWTFVLPSIHNTIVHQNPLGFFCICFFRILKAIVPKNV